jgi:hypothetical protein
MGSDTLQVHEPVDRPEQMVQRHMPLQREHVEQARLIDLPLANHHHFSRLKEE